MVLLDHRKLLDHDAKTTQAFLSVIQRHVRRYFKRKSQIHDVSQAAMVEVLDKLHEGADPDPSRIRFWVLNCASNAVRRELTRVRRQVVAYESRLHGEGVATRSASEAVGASQELARIDELLRDCSEVAQQTLAATVQGDTHRDIATQLGMSPVAVRMTLSRVRAQLRDRATARDRLERLRWLAKQAGYGRSSLSRTKRASNPSST